MNKNLFFIKKPVTIHLKSSIIYGLSIPKVPNIYLTTKYAVQTTKGLSQCIFPRTTGTGVVE